MERIVFELFRIVRVNSRLILLIRGYGSLGLSLRFLIVFVVGKEGIGVEGWWMVGGVEGGRGRLCVLLYLALAFFTSLFFSGFLCVTRCGGYCLFLFIFGVILGGSRLGFFLGCSDY